MHSPIGYLSLVHQLSDPKSLAHESHISDSAPMTMPDLELIDWENNDSLEGCLSNCLTSRWTKFFTRY